MVRKFVLENFSIFQSREGSGAIASRGSQLNLIELLIEHSPKKVLDWGAGIGTLIPLYQHVGVKQIVAFERNAWCREQFIKNVVNFDNGILVSSLPRDIVFDFVTIDDEIESQYLARIIGSKTYPQIIFVEGWRNRTIVRVSYLLLRRGLVAEFVRCKDRSSELGLAEREKSGSFFVLRKGSRFESLNSWIGRRNATFESREIRNFFLRKLHLFELMAQLKLGSAVRKVFRIEHTTKESYWKRVY